MRSKNNLGIIIFLIASILIVTFGIAHHFYSCKDYVKIEAVTTNVYSVDYDDEGSSSYIDLEYEYNGEKYSITRKVTTTLNKQIGQKVIVKCDPDIPSIAEDTYMRDFFIIIDIVLLIALLMVIVISRSQNSNESKQKLDFDTPADFNTYDNTRLSEHKP